MAFELEPKNLLSDLGLAFMGHTLTQGLEEICSPEAGTLVLEAGCGSGKLGLYYALRGASVVAVDIDPDAIHYSERVIKAAEAILGVKLSIKVMYGDINNLAFPNDFFDLVFNEGVMEHFWVPDHGGWTLSEDIHTNHRIRPFEEMFRVLKPSRSMAVMVPNAEHPEQKRISKEDKCDYRGMPEKELPFREDELKKLMEVTGLESVVLLYLMDQTGEKGDVPRYFLATGVKR